VVGPIARKRELHYGRKKSFHVEARVPVFPCGISLAPLRLACVSQVSVFQGFGYSILGAHVRGRFELDCVGLGWTLLQRIAAADRDTPPGFLPINERNDSALIRTRRKHRPFDGHDGLLTGLAFYSHATGQPRQPGGRNQPVRLVRRFWASRPWTERRPPAKGRTARATSPTVRTRRQPSQGWHGRHWFGFLHPTRFCA
jgi:hypothetical protein